ncbi:hypothetical protein PHYBLDRAFT_158530, partial [Phycomyces blakesleeanus NRRL 1555(-)]
MKKDCNATLEEPTNAMRLMIGKYICKNNICKAIFFSKDGNLRIWRFPLEKFKSDCIMPRVQFGGGLVMVWGCPLKRIINSLDQFGYINLLERKLLPFYGCLSERHDGKFIYQDNNAPCH